MTMLIEFARRAYRALPIPFRFRTLIHKMIRSVRPSGLSDGPMPPDRRIQILRHISPATQEGLEFGALCNPLITKAESGGRVYYVDFSTAAESRAKFRDDPNVRIDEIVETDYLCLPGPLSEVVQGKLFDYAVASHVIEHVPNMLGWLREIADVLKDDGILALAIPDKRYTFDYIRDVTSLGELIQSYLMNKSRPGIKEIFDHLFQTTNVDNFMAWKEPLDPEKLSHPWTIEEAFAAAQKSLRSTDYENVHVTILTPRSFIEILQGASQLNLFDFSVIDFRPTERPSPEFFVSLQRLPRGIDQVESRRRQLVGFEKAKHALSVQENAG